MLCFEMQDSLGGNCNTYLIACIWTSVNHAWETLSTLRFASRMKCIENTPVRNSLVPKDSSTSVRPLMNQIDALKKELAIRDMLCGKSEPWLCDLSKGQTVRACKSLTDYMTVPSDLSDYNPQSTSSISYSEFPDVHSLAEVRFMLSMAREMIWDACGRSESEVFKLTNKLKSKFVPSAISIGGRERVDQGSIFDSEAACAIGTEDPLVNGANELNHDSTVRTSVSGRLSFEEFKQTVGRDAQTSYEDVKRSLKDSKERQRHLVRTINTQKGIIDSLNEAICKYRTDNNDSKSAGEKDTSPGSITEISIEQYEANLSNIEIAKKTYREAHAELISCKKEIEEKHYLKKKYLSEVLNAYDAYCIIGGKA